MLKKEIWLALIIVLGVASIVNIVLNGALIYMLILLGIMLGLDYLANDKEKESNEDKEVDNDKK